MSAEHSGPIIDAALYCTAMTRSHYFNELLVTV